MPAPAINHQRYDRGGYEKDNVVCIPLALHEAGVSTDGAATQE